MKIIKTIGSNFNLKELTDVFNLSFSDYVIKFVVTEESLSQKIQGDDISMDHSIGIYSELEENKLEGFVLLAPDDLKNPKRLYNAATGVVPTARGNKLIEKSISQTKSFFKENGIKSIVLEVIQTNPRAIKVYENCGFKINRELISYKGDFKSNDSLIKYLDSDKEFINNIMIEKVEKLTDHIIYFIENENGCEKQPRMNPSWSNTNQVIQREFNMGFNKIWLAKDNKTNEIIGFLSIHSKSERIRQIYVKPTYRNKNVATKLIYTMLNEFQSFNVSNIEEGFDNLKNFFSKRIGLDFFVSQYEMELFL
ncbi:hypothetical protein RB653_009328 [Dictyostelium firmibasis]|uniref:N-acetyltransferase domain-containing protein n=1 Tax=Dictyostelium firmibasis TaxID=79012 RepID=A0AAN7U3W9_9MYCE